MSAARAPAVVRGAWVLTMDHELDALRDAAVAIASDGSIAAVGAATEVTAAYPDAETVGNGEGIVMPGMVNAHTHLTECLIPGMAETASLWEWFERVVNPAGMLLTRDDVCVGTRLRAAEMLLSGITTVNDMSCYRSIGSRAALGAVDGLAELGMRGVVSFGAEDAYDGAPPPAEFMVEHEALAERCGQEELIGFRAGIGTVLGVSDELMRLTVEACGRQGWAVHTHLAEVREELTDSRLRHGVGTIEHASRVGLLDHDTIAGHCIWCDQSDIEVLDVRDVAVAYNPVSNMLLGSGVCPIGRLRREGIRIGLGTDGAASNDNQDMFGVLKTAALLQKVAALDPKALTARQVLEMATCEGARALSNDGDVGSLVPGKRADVVLLDGDTPELATLHDPWQQLVYAATPRCVSDVWVDGNRRVRDGALVGADLATLAREARGAAAGLARRGGTPESLIASQTADEAANAGVPAEPIGG